jgi:hypothetical protein
LQNCNSLWFFLEIGFSPRFINKAATAEPIQGGEENLLQSRSKIKQKKNTENLNLPLETDARNQVESGLHNDAPKRVTTQRAAADETARSKVFTRSQTTGRIPTTTPPRG